MASIIHAYIDTCILRHVGTWVQTLFKVIHSVSPEHWLFWVEVDGKTRQLAGL